MKISEFTQTEVIEDQVKILLVERDDKPKIEELKKEWDPKKHRVIVDQEFLKDKELKNAQGQKTGTKKVNRIAGPYQKMIVKRSVSFGFGNDVEIEHNAKPKSDEEKVLNIVKKILEENKIHSFNRKQATEMYRAAEAAALWWYQKVDTPHTDYSDDPCNYELNVKLLTPWTGDKLLPQFDVYDKMKVFSRLYSVNRPGGKKDEYMDVYTSDEFKRFKKGDSGWLEDVEKIDDGFKPIWQENIISKIPVAYGFQEDAEWRDVQYHIERLELLLSRHAEINDYHAAPKTFIEGKLVTMPEAGEANGVLQGEPGTKAYVLSWTDSPESIKLEIETHLENIHKFTQTPDISFKSVKGLSQISGVMLKMLFMDAHLKVMEKEEIWDDYFTRSFNIIKTFVGKLLYPNLEQAANRLKMKPRFKPYMIDDTKAWIETLMAANGNLPVLSQQKSVEMSGLTNDPTAEWVIIQAETEANKAQDVFQTTNL